METARKIVGQESLLRWLEGRPQADAGVIASRSACRVLPLFGRVMDEEWAVKLNLTALPVLRLLLTSRVATRFPAIEIGATAINAAFEAAAAAHSASRTAASRAGDTAGYAATRRATDSVTATTNAAVHAATTDTTSYSIASTVASADVDFVWEQASTDALWLEQGDTVAVARLWNSSAPDWFTAADAEMQAIWAKGDAAHWAFWTRWWEGVKEGHDRDWELQRQVAEIDDAIWEAGPGAVAAEIEKLRVGGGRTPLAAAALFDFIEANRKMRMVGFEADLSHLKDAAIVEQFRKDTQELRDGLVDWRDYAADKRGRSNAPVVIVGVVEKLISELDRVGREGEIRARRLLTLGSDLRRFALEGDNREELGDALSEMLDDRIDRFGEVSAKYLAPVLARLEPLNRLELGDHDPTVMIEVLRAAVQRARQIAPEDLAELEPGSRAVLDDMIRELDELDAGIAEARSPKAAEILRQRFAARYGGVSATFGRYVEKAKEFGGSSTKRFDDAVKSYKRWETLE